jgi:hypothetical protein
MQISLFLHTAFRNGDFRCMVTRGVEKINQNVVLRNYTIAVGKMRQCRSQ